MLLASLAPALSLGAPPSPAAAADKVTFTVALTNEVDSFNPFLGIEAESFEMWALMYDYMITYSMDDMSPEPGLAKSWDTSEDGLTWTFHIRDGINWSDGEPLTAQDIAYTYNRILDGGPESATWGSYLKGVTSVTAPDDTTVVLKTAKPNAVLPLLPIPIIPEHIWKDVSEKDVKTYSNEPEDGQPVVGSGPFRLVEGKAGGDSYRFEANPDYWQGTPHIDEVAYRVYKSEDPAIAALKKGEVDFAEAISPIQVKALQGEPGITAINGNSPSFDEIAFNTGSVDVKTGKPIGDPNPAMLDPKFRYALGFAIDRDKLIETVYQGAGEPGTTIIPPAYSQWRWDPPEDVAFSFDLDRAGELLDEAGYKLGSDGLRTQPDGSPIGTLRLAARSDSDMDASLNTMNYFKEWLGELGIQARVDTYESSKLTDVILDGTFDMFQWGWYVEPDPQSMLSYLTCDQRGNWSDSWYCNKKYDKLFDEQSITVDRAKRAEIVKKMQEMLYVDAPYLVTAYSTIGEAVRSDRFACLRPQPDPGGIWLFQYGAYNYINMRPASEASECAGDKSASQATAAGESGGVSTGVLVGGGIVLLALLGAGGVAMMRRRSTTDDRE
ncbi:MAG: ABC transporter substrate-binding protein [Nocardioides sp.]|uniref:ABC transporter substrate-binding protein n=1 Tax=Nocardioides sp. TaxID=35761 RepID=UPI0039E3F6D3